MCYISCLGLQFWCNAGTVISGFKGSARLPIAHCNHSQWLKYWNQGAQFQWQFYSMWASTVPILCTRHTQCANTCLALNHAAIYEFERWVITKTDTWKEWIYDYVKVVRLPIDLPSLLQSSLAVLSMSGSCTRMAQVTVVVQAVFSWTGTICHTCRKPTPQSGRLLVVLWTAVSVLKDNAQWADVIGLA